LRAWAGPKFIREAQTQGRKRLTGHYRLLWHRRIASHGAQVGRAILARLGFGHGILAMLAQRGDHLMRQPALEALGFALARGEDEPVNAGLGDRCRILLAAGVGNTDLSPFILIQPSQRILVVHDIQHAAHILAHEPGRALAHHHTNQIIIKNIGDHLRAHRRIPCASKAERIAAVLKPSGSGARNRGTSHVSTPLGFRLGHAHGDPG
jgi:hypothetical protein